MPDELKANNRQAWLIGSAALLGGLTAYAQLQARWAERRYPPAGDFVTAGGVRLHYVDRGQGPPIVLLHGAGAFLQDFSLSILGPLAERYRAVAFDRPGYGHSERPKGRRWTPQAQAEVIHDALDQLGIGRPLLLGHSWGCLVALAYALRYPAEVSGIVLLAGYYYPVWRLDALINSAPAVPVIGPIFRNTVGPAIDRLALPAVFRKLFAPNPVPPQTADYPIGLMIRPSQIRALGEDIKLLRTSAATMSPHYRSLRLPVAILAGAGDRIVDPRRHALRLQRDLPSASLRLLPDTGHMIHYVRQPEVLDAIAEIWRRAEESGRVPHLRAVGAYPGKTA